MGMEENELDRVEYANSGPDKGTFAFLIVVFLYLLAMAWFYTVFGLK